MNIETLIEQVILGNTHAFSEIVEEYKDMVYRMAWGFTNDAGEAQDISQEVFINAYKNLKAFNSGAKFSTWLYRICCNTCISWSRRNKKRIEKYLYTDNHTDDFEGGTNPEEGYLSKQDRLAIRQELLKLKDKYRTVIILYHYQGLSYEEIGEILDIGQRTIETRLYRGRAKLRSCLKKHFFGGEDNELQTDY